MYKQLLILFFIACSASGCKKDKSEVPNTQVDIYVYTSSPQYNHLNTPGNWAYVTGGVRGIIVYRRSIEEFKAYDRSCTYQPANSCEIVSIDSTNIFAVDACCGSKFQIIDNTVVNGPASQPLREYNTHYDGNTLHIYN